MWHYSAHVYHYIVGVDAFLINICTSAAMANLSGTQDNPNKVILAYSSGFIDLSLFDREFYALRVSFS